MNRSQWLLLRLGALFFGSLLLTLTVPACGPVQSPSASPTAPSALAQFPPPSPTATAGDGYEARLNQYITIQGVADNAKSGAVVMTADDTPIYLEGLAEWDSAVVQQPVVVSGTLRQRKAAPTAVAGSNGDQRAGIVGDSYLLENPTWKITK